MGKKGGRGKRKGSGWERKCCVALSKWLTQGKRSDCLWRTAMSGGRATVRGAANVRQAGDICAVAEEGHILTDVFLIECKFYRNMGVDQFVLFNSGHIRKWLNRTAADALEHKKTPMLIAKQNNTPPLVFVPISYPLSVPTKLLHREWFGWRVFFLSDWLMLPPDTVLRRKRRPLLGGADQVDIGSPRGLRGK